jgi:hypothetical protein
LVVYFEGDTSDLDRAYARAQKRRSDFIKETSRSDDVRISGDDTDLNKTYDKAQKDNERFVSNMTKNSMIKLQGDSTGLNKVYSQARRSQESFIRDANRASTVKLKVDDGGFNTSLSRSSGSLSDFSDQSRTTETDSDRLSNAFSRLGGSSSGASDGLHELSQGMRSVKTVFMATTVVPAVIAAIGGIPAIATAAAGAVGQLAIGVGQGLAGAMVIGGSAVYGAVGALKAYHAAISTTISDSREAYFALNEQAEAQLENQRNQILNTQASRRFNEQISASTIGLTRMQAAIGNRVFPQFTREMQAWGPIMSRNRGIIADTAGTVAGTAVAFTKWFRTKDDGQVLDRTLGFINHSARTGAQALSNIGATGILAFQKVIPYARTLQERIVGLTRDMYNWVDSAQGSRVLGNIMQTLSQRFTQLQIIVGNVTRGLVGVFVALNNQGGVDRLMTGLVDLSRGFDTLMAKGNGARQAIVNFMNRSSPALNQTWKLTKELVVQFGLLANNVVKAGQSGGKMGTLAQVIKGIRVSLSPLRKMFQETFIALGPVLARLTPEVVKFLTVFLGSTGPLVTFLRTITAVLRVFNNMPGPVKSLIANLVALRAILGGLGITAFVGSIIKARTATAALSVATGRQVTSLGILKAAFLGTGAAAKTSTTATAATGTAAAASAGRFGRFGGVLAAAGRGLLTFGRFAGPVGLVLATLATGAIIVAKNWGRIKAAVAPATRGVQAFMNAVRPVVRELRGALGAALGAMVNGFIQAVSPSKNLGDATRSLASIFGRLARAAIPPVVAGLRAVANWLEEHQRAFRVVGRIVGTVLVSGFRVWGAVLRTTWKIISGTVRVIGGLINIVRRVTTATRTATKDWGQALRRFGSGAMRIIRQFGSAFIKAWQNSIWGRAAKFLVERARGMIRTLGNFRQDAVKWVRSLVPNVGKPWQNFWQSGATFLSRRKQGERTTLSNFLSDTVKWVQSFPGKVGTLWRKFWQGSADFVVKIKDGILGTMDNLVSGVKSAWNSLIGFINDVLNAVGLDPIGSGSSGGGGSPAPSGAGGRARGGLDTGKYGDPTREPLNYMARGGVTDKPRVVYGEAGPEAYVTLGRYTKESAEALQKANEVWRQRGWMERAVRETGTTRAHRSGRTASDQLASRSRTRNLRGGEGLGPTTHNWSPLMQGYKSQLDKEFPGTTRNTYVGHPGGEQNSMDNWGAGGRGSNIDPGTGDAISSWIQGNVDQLNWLIWKGRILDASGWGSYNDPNDQHFDHVHFTAGSPGGGAAGDALSIWERVGEAMWNRLVGPIYNTFMRWQDDDKFALRRGAGKAGTNALDSIRSWIISQTGGTGVSSDALGGDPGKNRALGEEMFKSSGIGGSFSSLDKLWMKESGWDRFARNASSGAYGIPQALPESKLPAEGQRSGGSKAGPQISWGLNYIDDRYGSTDKAWGHSQSTGWYARGGIIPGVKGKQVMVQAHAGERVLPPDMVKSFDRLAQTIQGWSRNIGGHRMGRISVGPQGVQMPGLSVSARGIQINPRQLHRGAYAQEDTARTLRRVERRLGDLDKRIGKEVREGINRNVERGLNTNRALDKSDARRMARQLAGGPRISRAL